LNVKEVNELKMKKILRETAILLFAAAMCLSLIHFHQVKGDPHIDLVIFVDESIETHIQEALNTYMTNLDNEGWICANYTFNVTEQTPMGLRNLLAQFLFLHNINGCLLVGDFPYATWEDHVNGSSCPTDYYYMDLDGNWYDTDNDAVYDVHNGTIRPEIWVSRLKASNIEGNEIDLFNWYFEKNHLYRNASARADPELDLRTYPRALAYVDNSPGIKTGDLSDPDPVRTYETRFVNDTVACLKKAYDDVTLVASPILNATNTNANDYKSQIGSTHGYEFAWIYGHGIRGEHGFMRYFWIEEEEKWEDYDYYPSEGRVYHSYYLSNLPRAFFYIFGFCESARFDSQNNIASSALFGDGSGLVSIGLSNGSFPAYWFNESYKAMVLLGDPTIKINSPPHVPSQPLGQESGYLEVTYDYSANTTDLNGDQIWYQFDWDDGTNMTVGPYDSGETGNASHAWSCPGTYSVKVRAKDNYTVWSDWSEPLNVTITERIRYMQNAKWDSTYWKLFWNNTSTSTSRVACKVGWYMKGYLGVKVYKGTTRISGDDVIEVGYWYNLQSGEKSTMWNCTEEHNVTGTYIKIEIWYKFHGCSWTSMNVAFKTETFTENTILNATTWTIILHGEFHMESGPLNVGPNGFDNRASIRFSWGSESRESRIEDMTFTHG
jgi:hypothetical protein